MTGLFFELAQFVKLSHIIGSWASFFSVNSIGVPMIGVCAGLSTGLLSTVVRAGVRLMLYGTSPLRFLVYHIPGVCASGYWFVDSKLVRIVLPLICMGLFVLHPVGQHAPEYALYWLIPVIIGFFSNRSVFMRALAATFMAHAIGSVIWLYTISSTPIMWHALIPIVAVERLVFASGMSVVYYVVQYVRNWGWGRVSCSMQKNC